MNIADLRHRVEIQDRTGSADALGQPSTTWSTTATVWANVRYLTGVSAIKAGVDASVSKCSIRMRHRVLNAAQRIVYGDETFEIEAVLPDGRGEYVDAVCVVINVDV